MKWFFCSGLAVAAALSGWSYWQLASAPGDTGSQGGASSESTAGTPIHGIGYVEPVTEVRKLMLRTGGVIDRCYVTAGDRVRKGGPLVELNNATHRADVEIARRQLEAARAEAEHVESGINPHQIKAVEQAVERLKEKVRFYRVEADRSRNLQQTKATSRQDRDAAETLLKQTEAELREKEAELLHLRNHVTPEHRALLAAKVRQAAAALASAEERLKETVLIAPFDGAVLKVLRREGEGVRTFEPEPVVLFGDLSRLHVRAEIDERFVNHLSVGQEAVIYGRNVGGKEHRGRVVVLEPIMGDKTVFTRTSAERKDMDVIQVVILMDTGFTAPIGLQVDVMIERLSHSR